jgi:cation diffusion facilitator CzcD-associated flavoprotein CzcO
MHSANWDPNTKLDGQRIGVIGNGSSGIQILTALQPGMFPLSPDIFYAVLE